MSDARRPDVLIAGAGVVGLTLAIALRQSLGDAFHVVVADPMLGSDVVDPRASAIIAAGRRMFDALGVWSRIAEETQAIQDMAITDSRLGAVARPALLNFGGDVEPGEPLAHMADNATMMTALLAQARQDGIAFEARTVALHDQARLIVAADGARSSLRARAGIATHGWSYPQSGIVTTVTHEREHSGRAEEHFLPAGPFAILPLKGKRSSIVWTERSCEAERIVALPASEFHDELEQRFGLHLGNIEAVGPRRAYPLEFFVARSFIADRLALIGDAAHVIHPIAGQGLNMGLKDVAALAEAVVDAARLGMDIGGPVVLDRYQQWRRFDTMTMAAATDGLNRLFSNDSDVLRALRDLGLGLVERMPGLKRAVIREAAGLSGDVPRLLRGEAL